ncbi:hypothetical protein AAHA92_11376 [Salvia divinorum]|uniref:Phorbol-ester/DAG-type domain-containing protein n=1 Tax=Salvia divinorum TaxID=28513 RepID=A0ABD1HI58_SALDI
MNPKYSIDHFTHPHRLTAADFNHEFLCNGCMTIGISRRFRCNACDFDLHEYCATCPRSLHSFMHPHPLTLLLRTPASAKSTRVVCDLCRETVEWLFYRCDECNFDLHPLCTQLPQKLNHALHRIHPLILQSLPAAGACAVCRRLCVGWRYACRSCRVDIHFDCVLKPVVWGQKHDRSGSSTGQQGITIFNQNKGIPFHAQPGFAPRYGYHGGSVNNSNNNNGGSRLRKSMFGLVMKLGIGVISNMIFGVDVSGLLFTTF